MTASYREKLQRLPMQRLHETNAFDENESTNKQYLKRAQLARLL